MDLDAVRAQQSGQRWPQGEGPLRGSGQEPGGTPGDARHDAAEGTSFGDLARFVGDHDLTLGTAQCHLVTQMPDRVHSRFHEELVVGAQRGAGDLEQQGLRGAAARQDLLAVLRDVQGHHLTGHLEIR